MKELFYVQQHLRSKKDKSDDKGRYKYRTAEDILEAAKPHLAEVNATVICSDFVFECSNNIFFIKSTATLYVERDGAMTAIASADGYAQLDDHISKKFNEKTKEWYEVRGMSNEQCTGSASSYARKYALCGLFAIDNSDNDPDSMSGDDDPQEQPKAAPKNAAPAAAPKAEQPKAETWESRINALKTADDFTAFMKDIKNAPKGMPKLFMNRAAELKIVFSKQDNKYVQLQK
jgi:hypothetical protein